MSALSVEAPYTIASLTKPFDRENGRIHASPVYTIDGSRKRKRHEIAAAIDGEALNIYNVMTKRPLCAVSWLIPLPDPKSESDYFLRTSTANLPLLRAML